MTEERRAVSRCPICSGPVKSDPNNNNTIRCRNSSCKQNHLDVICPRCKATDLAQVVWRENKWHYTCRDCEHHWSVVDKN